MSLIAVSPIKTGVAFTGIDPEKFIQRPRAAGVSVGFLQFLGDRFWIYGSSGSASNIYHMYDPTVGMDGLVYSAGTLGLQFYGMDWDGGTGLVHNSIDNGNTNIGSAYVSGDMGASWTPRPYPTSAWWRGVAYGIIEDGTPVWLSCGRITNGSAGVFLARSTDGGWTWVNRSTSTGYAGADKIAFNPTVKKFLACVFNGAVYRISSDGGLTWSVVPNMNVGSAMRDIFCINGKFVMLFNTPTIGFSDDGINWNISSFPNGVTGNNWARVVCAEGLWFVLNGTNVFMYSTDGVNWSAGTFPNGLAMQHVAYGNGQVVFMGTGASAYFFTYAI